MLLIDLQRIAVLRRGHVAGLVTSVDRVKRQPVPAAVAGVLIIAELLIDFGAW